MIFAWFAPKNEKNQRLAASLNHCLQYAGGKYIARQDGDDISLPRRFEKQVAFLESQSHYHVVGSLGLGAQAPNPEWGKMLADARPYLAQAPWTLFFPGFAIMLTVLGFNLMGDGLRDTLDPKMKEGK